MPGYIYNYAKALDTPPVIADMILLMKKEGTQSNPVHPPDEEGALDQCSLLIRRAPDQCSLLARRALGHGPVQPPCKDAALPP